MVSLLFFVRGGERVLNYIRIFLTLSDTRQQEYNCRKCRDMHKSDRSYKYLHWEILIFFKITVLFCKISILSDLNKKYDRMWYFYLVYDKKKKKIQKKRKEKSIFLAKCGKRPLISSSKQVNLIYSVQWIDWSKNNGYCILCDMIG